MESDSSKALLTNLVSDDSAQLTSFPAFPGSAAGAGNPYDGVELEDLFLSLGKRIYAQIDMIVMMFNTINSVFAISAAVGQIPKDELSWMFNFCEYGGGEPLGVSVQCPYLPNPVFISFLTAWIIYFSTIFAYRFHRTFDFWSNDLRFYVACDLLNNDMFMYILAFVGVVLTLVSAIGGIYYVTVNGSTASLGNILVFTGVNMLNLKGLVGGRFKALAGQRNAEKVFPQPIIIALPNASAMNLHGALLSHRDVFDIIVQANGLALLERDDKVLRRVGDVALLREAIRILMPPELTK